MKDNYLKEDVLPSKLNVVFSSKIKQIISLIDSYNKDNVEGISNWYDYLEWVKDYISNPVIAFDYLNKHPRFPNGAIFVSDFNINIAFSVKTNDYTNQLYVYVFMINLNTEEFGLKLPPKQNKQVVKLTENHLRKIIRECVIKVVKEYPLQGKHLKAS